MIIVEPTCDTTLTLRRKTGVTLKDNGVRDEHGLEPIDGIFSSPEKDSPVKKVNGAGNGNGNSTLTDGEMEIGESARCLSFDRKTVLIKPTYRYNSRAHRCAKCSETPSATTACSIAH